MSSLSDALPELAASGEQLELEPNRPRGPGVGPHGVREGLALQADAEIPDSKHLPDPSAHWNQPAFAASGLPVCRDRWFAGDETSPVEN